MKRKPGKTRHLFILSGRSKAESRLPWEDKERPHPVHRALLGYSGSLDGLFQDEPC
jgi:hypothetical protein